MICPSMIIPASSELTEFVYISCRKNYRTPFSALFDDAGSTCPLVPYPPLLYASDTRCRPGIDVLRRSLKPLQLRTEWLTADVKYTLSTHSHTVCHQHTWSSINQPINLFLTFNNQTQTNIIQLRSVADPDFCKGNAISDWGAPSCVWGRTHGKTYRVRRKKASKLF